MNKTIATFNNAHFDGSLEDIIERQRKEDIRNKTFIGRIIGGILRKWNRRF